MLNKTFSGGLTYRGAVNTLLYLLNERVSLGTARILDGDVGITKELIQLACSKFKAGWSSGVLSFEETISEDIMREIIAEHKRVTFCGMNEDQYNSLYILHTDKNRTEIHYMCPKIELSTGKMLNPYYVKRDFKKKDLFQDYMNAKHDLSSPKYKQSKELVTKNKKKWATKKSTIQKEIDEAVLNLVNAGDVQSRDDIIDFLRENGFEINRLRKEGISILHEDVKRKDGTLMPIPLKGAIYGESFTDWGSLNRSLELEDKEARRGADEIKKDLDRIVGLQTIYNRERYKPRKRSEQSQQTAIGSGIGRDGVGSEVSQSERADRDQGSEQYETGLLLEAERGIIYDRYRDIAETGRRSEEKSREEAERGRREALAGFKGVADEFHRGRSAEASISPDQRNLEDRIREHFAPDPTISTEAYRIGAVGYYTAIQELNEDLAEAVSIEGELEQFEDILEHEINNFKDGFANGLWNKIRGKIESLTGTLDRIGEQIVEYLDNKLVKDTIAKNEKSRSGGFIKSILVDEDIDQVSFPKPKR